MFTCIRNTRVVAKCRTIAGASFSLHIHSFASGETHILSQVLILDFTELWARYSVIIVEKCQDGQKPSNLRQAYGTMANFIYLVETRSVGRISRTHFVYVGEVCAHSAHIPIIVLIPRNIIWMPAIFTFPKQLHSFSCYEWTSNKLPVIRVTSHGYFVIDQDSGLRNISLRST